ncbi:nitrogen fixation protein NifZ [Azovibrio restrictus]|uniref:nitrogen fixation protein NifZ n=1 Tax=Azovibrio restrictus TaxID=146938 RepID=UPI00041D6256|nr:nitrogen fixation protein NifZ [Azovibrio restrictus]MCE1170520.1 nitrogen fixation protein NifZ [Azovibrio sp.]
MGEARYFNIGDVVYARESLYNDGGVPDVAEDALLVQEGCRGVVVNIGFLEADEDQEIFLVRFEGEGGILGGPVGCLPEELTQDEALAAA